MELIKDTLGLVFTLLAAKVLGMTHPATKSMVRRPAITQQPVLCALYRYKRDDLQGFLFKPPHGQGHLFRQSLSSSGIAVLIADDYHSLDQLHDLVQQPWVQVGLDLIQPQDRIGPAV